ncbi:hypothetical protein M3Y97_00969600 [Aphelenchoides bicaudatus]|nr:hypothetical protein M3Y97_00969600 [Aphelenchoides bicaudatus]
MQPTLQAFFNGQAAEARPKQQQQKRNTVTEVYFGQAFRDDATETAALICNFLDAFYHQIVCIYGRYPAENIKPSSFNGVLTTRCTDKRVVEYFQLSRPTLRRWLLHQQIRTFVVVLLNPDNETVAEFRVNFYEPKVGMKKFVHDFDSEIEQLNQQLRQSLISLQTSPELQFVCDLPLAPSFQIHIHSNGELEEPQTSTEHEWTNADLNSQIGTLHTNNSQRVSCPLGEMRFNYISFEPTDPEDIHELDEIGEIEKESHQSSSNSSDVIVLD